MLLIGICGKRNTGKDTVAGILQNNFPTDTSVQLIAFADRLKAICAATFDLPLEVFNDQTMKEKLETPFGTPRELMITMSDAVKDKYGVGFFVDVVRSQIKKNDRDCIIVTDIRYEREAAMIRNLGGYVIHLQRDTGLPAINHESELGVHFNGADYLVENNSTLVELHGRVSHVFSEIINLVG